MAEKKDRIPNRQAYSRISFLYQASNYFATLPSVEQSGSAQNKHGFPLSSYLASQLMTIGRKGPLRIAPSIKRSICKRCKVVLRPGSTSAVSLENKSIDGNKPHADVLLVACLACGMQKRYPLRQKPDKIEGDKAI